MGSAASTNSSLIDYIVTKGIDLKQEENTLQTIVNKEKANFKNYRVKGTEVAEKVISDLKKYDPKSPKQLSIARSRIAGSIGKRSSLGPGANPDFDVVTFLNLKYDKPPELEKLVKDQQKVFKSILDSVPGGYTKVKVGKVALGVTAADGTEFDLVPAVSFHKPHEHTKPVEAQWKGVLEMEYFYQGSNLRWLYSSFADKVVDYVERKDDFVHRTIILAKMWNANRVGDIAYVPARSTIVELVAVKSAEVEIQRARSSNGQPKLTLALLRVLEVFAKPMNQVQVVFEDVQFPIETARAKFNKVKNSKGILLDPVNPYNNFLEDEEGRVRSMWPTFQKVAVQCLQDAETYWKNVENGMNTKQNIQLLEQIVYGESSSCCIM